MLSDASCLCQGTAEQGFQKTLDATKALPDAITAALAAALQKADLPSRLPFADQVDGQPAFQVSSLTSESQQQLRLLVSQELAQAVQQINSAQVCSSIRVQYQEPGLYCFLRHVVPNHNSVRSLALTALLHMLKYIKYHPYVESGFQSVMPFLPAGHVVKFVLHCLSQ